VQFSSQLIGKKPASEHLKRGGPVLVLSPVPCLTTTVGGPAHGDNLHVRQFALDLKGLRYRCHGCPAFAGAQEGSGTKRDDIVVLEVMTDQLDREWWRSYRRDLERAFRQEAIVVRAQKMDLL
jgi:hypothetical protein